MIEPVNWLLFYKHVGALPSEFAELLACDDTLFQRTGNVKTWGQSQETTFAGIQDLQAAFDRGRSEIEAGGFVLARESRFDPSVFDFDRLTNEIEQAARRAFTAIRDSHPDEDIRAYAIITDDSAMTIGPVANSVQAFQAAKNDPDVFWNSAEWSFREGGEYFDVAYRMLLTQHQGTWPKVPFEEFTAGVAEAAIRALERLDRESFFGSSQDRDENIVLFQVADSEYLDDAIKRLNTPRAYSQFKDWWAGWN